MAQNSPSIFIPVNIFRKAEVLIRKGDGASLREGVELILQHDLSIVTSGKSPAPGSVDAGKHLHDALTHLANAPFEALSIPLGSQTVDVRKAYKKMALKYHPDKNPKTTPLFQAIKTACDKLENAAERSKEAKKAKDDVSVHNNSKHASGNNGHPTDTCNGNKASSRSSDSNNQQKTSGASEKGNANHQGYGAYNYSSNDNKSKSKPTQSTPASEKYFNDVKKEDAQKRAAEMRDRRASELRAKAEEDERMRELATKHREDILRGAKYAYQQYNFGKPKQKPASDEQPRTQSHVGGKFDNNKDHINSNNTTRKTNNTTNSNNPYTSRSESHYDSSDFRSYQNGNGVASSKPTANSNIYPGKPFGEMPGAPAPAVHRPYNLRCVGNSATAIDLEWKKSLHSNVKTSTELNWRAKGSLSYIWESPNQLIIGETCRKNNLISGITYEFRVRVVAELSGGMLGPRSDWSDTLVVKTISTHGERDNLQPPQSDSVKTSSTAYQSKASSETISSHNNSKSSSGERQSTKGIKTDYFSSKKQAHKMSSSENSVEIKGNYMESKNHFQSRNGMFKEVMSSDSDDGMDIDYRKKSEHMNDSSATNNHQRKDLSSKPTELNNSESKATKDIGNPLSRTKSAWEDFSMKEEGSESEVQEINSDDDTGINHVNNESFRYQNFTKYYDKKSVPLKTNIQDSDQTKIHPSMPSKDKKIPVENGDQSSDVDDKWYNLISPPSSLIQKKMLSTGRSFQIIDGGQYQHPVHEDPVKNSKVLGFLTANFAVQVRSEVAGWMKVKIHKRNIDKTKKHPNLIKVGRIDGWGWCMQREDGHNYLSPINSIEEEESLDDEDVEVSIELNEKNDLRSFDHHALPNVFQDEGHKPAPVWYERRDDEGNSYYVNSETGESKWEAPEWVEEFDEKTGASYYVHLDQYSANPLHSTWSKPEIFAKLIRSAMSKHEEVNEIEHSDDDYTLSTDAEDNNIKSTSSRSQFESRDQNLSYENDFEDDEN